MATYYIEQSLLSAKVRTLIKDDKNQPAYLLVGSWGSKGDSVSVYHLDGRLLAKAKQTTLSVRPQFDLFMHHEKVGVLKRLFFWQRDFYFIKKLNWLAIGDIKKQKYQIYYLNDKLFEMTQVKRGNRVFFKMIVPDEKLAPLCICLVSVLDYWARKGTKVGELNSEELGNQLQVSYSIEESV